MSMQLVRLYVRFLKTHKINDSRAALSVEEYIVYFKDVLVPKLRIQHPIKCARNQKHKLNGCSLGNSDNIKTKLSQTS